MSTYDLTCPENRYAEEQSKLVPLIKEERAQQLLCERTSHATAAVEHRLSVWRYSNAHAALSQELTAQKQYRAYTEQRLAREKMEWFPRGPFHPSASAMIFTQ